MKRTALNQQAEFGFLCMRNKKLPYNVLMKKIRTNPTAKLSYQIVEAIPCIIDNNIDDNDKCLFPPYPYSASTRDRQAIDTLVTTHKEFDAGIKLISAVTLNQQIKDIINTIPKPKEVSK